jgi:hypothetical protein
MPGNAQVCQNAICLMHAMVFANTVDKPEIGMDPRNPFVVRHVVPRI